MNDMACPFDDKYFFSSSHIEGTVLLIRVKRHLNMANRPNNRRHVSWGGWDGMG
jgi:hypothetical protein